MTIIKYEVFENNKPARFPEQNIHPSWDNNRFDTLREAQEYTLHYLGVYGTTDVLHMPPGEKFVFFGTEHGECYMIIKEVYEVQ